MTWDPPPANKPTRQRLYLELRQILADQIAEDLEADRPSKALWLLSWLHLLKPRSRR